MDEQMIEWRCFHCGDVFTDRRSAEAHFGPNEDSAPACQIKAGAEGSLVRALRTVEQELADARSDIATESTEAAKAYYSQQTRHYAQLQAAEEAGYERGLSDAREESAAAHSVMAGKVAELELALKQAAVDLRFAKREFMREENKEAARYMERGMNTVAAALAPYPERRSERHE